MESLMAMGFPEHMCSKAMRMTGGDVEAAANYIMGAPARPPARPRCCVQQRPAPSVLCCWQLPPHRSPD
jgi:hypothetical protein